MKTKQHKVGENKSEVLKALPIACMDETKAVEFIEAQRWGEIPCCPHCGCKEVSQMKDKDGNRNERFLWRCANCQKSKDKQSQFTVRVGTVFESSRIPLKYWCYVFWRACTSKKGVSALEIQRQTGLSYKSALFLLHRIRYAMAPENVELLKGTVEVDETYVGGKPRYRGNNKRGRGTKKQPVLAMVERGGNVKAHVIPNVSGKTLKTAIRESVDKSSRIMTDENPSYNGLHDFSWGHHPINHSLNEYVRGDITTNTVESFFAIVKRGINGVYHCVSKKHLHRYLSEFEFRYNHRKLEDGERVVALIKNTQGKRLLYREPVSLN